MGKISRLRVAEFRYIPGRCSSSAQTETTHNHLTAITDAISSIAHVHLTRQKSRSTLRAANEHMNKCPASENNLAL
jgi:hypothetical protein